MSTTPVQDAMRLKARLPPFPYFTSALNNVLVDYHSLKPHHARDTQRLQHARAPPSDARQRVQRDAFPRLHHVRGLQIQDATCEAPDGVRLAKGGAGEGGRDTCATAADEDAGRGGEADCEGKNGRGG